MNDEERKLLTIEEAAAILKVSPRSLYNRTGKRSKNPLPFPTKRIGRLIRFLSTDVWNYVESL